jgi:transcriptional regulator with XRE-family HTH domain
MSLGQAIKNKRLEKGLSQKKLGELCDPKIDASNIRRIENGDVSPTTDTVVRIARALDVPVTDFFILDKEAYMKVAASDPDAFHYKMLVKDLFEYVCEKNGYIVFDEEAFGWAESFRLLGDNGIEFKIRHEDASTAFDRIVQHLLIELPAFLEEHKIDNGK